MNRRYAYPRHVTYSMHGHLAIFTCEHLSLVTCLFFVIYRRPFLQIITLTILRPLVLGINQCLCRYIFSSLYLSEPVSCLAQYSLKRYFNVLHIVKRRCHFWQIGLIQNKPKFRKQCLSKLKKYVHRLPIFDTFLIQFINLFANTTFFGQKSYCNWANFEKERVFFCFSVTALIHLF